MYTSWYERISQRYRNNAMRSKKLRSLNHALVYAVAALFAFCAICLISAGDTRIVRFLAVPAAVFILATLFRRILNAQRPYERYPIKPILAMHTRGRSLPSRHMASAAAIAFALTWIHPVAGIAGWIAAAAVAYARIVGGAHFPRDIIAAIALAFACSLIGYAAIPFSGSI